MTRTAPRYFLLLLRLPGCEVEFVHEPLKGRGLREAGPLHATLAGAIGWFDRLLKLGATAAGTGLGL